MSLDQLQHWIDFPQLIFEELLKVFHQQAVSFRITIFDPGTIHTDTGGHIIHLPYRYWSITLRTKAIGFFTSHNIIFPTFFGLQYSN